MSDFDLLNTSASKAAILLLGCELERNLNGQVLRGRIVETEAYDQMDSASHSFRGKTQRTEVMFGQAGYLYVYFTYGMHYCSNVVVGPEGYGAAVLIRAIQPLSGLGQMMQRRNNIQGPNLTNGPAKLCQALEINAKLNGHFLSESPLKLIIKPKSSSKDIISTTRIGISKAKYLNLRFYLKDNPYISKT
jgi:DNA-3-methyladenine glycosylase